MAQATKLFDLPIHAPAPAGGTLLPRIPPLPVVPPAGPQVPEALGPRKLVRPQLPDHLSRPAAAPRRLRGSAPLARHEGHVAAPRGTAPAASQAEAFYFQKQMQAQTPMVFVLEDGEQVRGVLEWFDRDTIKVRNSTRTLIYKHSIKYLYKAGEGAQA